MPPKYVLDEFVDSLENVVSPNEEPWCRRVLVLKTGGALLDFDNLISLDACQERRSLDRDAWRIEDLYPAEFRNKGDNRLDRLGVREALATGIQQERSRRNCRA